MRFLQNTKFPCTLTYYKIYILHEYSTMQFLSVTEKGVQKRVFFKISITKRDYWCLWAVFQPSITLTAPAPSLLLRVPNNSMPLLPPTYWAHSGYRRYLYHQGNEQTTWQRSEGGRQALVNTCGEILCCTPPAGAAPPAGGATPALGA